MTLNVVAAKSCVPLETRKYYSDIPVYCQCRGCQDSYYLEIRRALVTDLHLQRFLLDKHHFELQRLQHEPVESGVFYERRSDLAEHVLLLQLRRKTRGHPRRYQVQILHFPKEKRGRCRKEAGNVEEGGIRGNLPLPY